MQPLASLAPLSRPDGAPVAARSGRRAVFTLLVLAAASALNNVDRNMFGLILPEIKRDIHLSDLMLGFLSGPAFIIVYSLSGVPIAWIADRVNRRTIIAFGLAAWSLVTMATGAAVTMVQLSAARLALGVGEATNMAPASAMIADLFPSRSRAAAFAVFAAGGPVGVMIAFPIIGWLTQAHGWRSAFFAMGAVGIVMAGFVALAIREPRHGAGAGAGINAAQPAAPLGSREALALALGSPPFLILVAGGTCLSLDYGAMIAWVPTFLERVHHLGPKQVGAYIGLYRGLFGVIASLAGGFAAAGLARLDGRWLAWVPALLCLAMAPAELLLLFARSDAGWQAGLALDTLFLSAVIPCTFALLLALVDPRMRAFGTALYLMVFNLVGQSIGPLAVGALNERLAPQFGEAAVRYSLLIAPLGIVAAAVLLLSLAPHFANRED